MTKYKKRSMIRCPKWFYFGTDLSLLLTPPPWPAVRRKLPAGFFSFVLLTLCVCAQQKPPAARYAPVIGPLAE